MQGSPCARLPWLELLQTSKGYPSIHSRLVLRAFAKCERPAYLQIA